VIEEYEKHHPTVSGAEVREALSLASQGSKTAAPARTLVATLLLGLVALGAGLFYAVERSGGGGATEFPMMAVVIGVILVLGLVAVIKGKRNL
jgi:multisubunit Na+/H+ antiporter MnhB subunit